MTPALADDCFAIDDRLLPAPEAWTRLKALARPVVPAEQASLADAAGRILATDITAPRAVPPADNAAVDGYAFRAADLSPAGETRLPLAGRSAAGHPSSGPLAPGTAVRILTGAAVPDGADSVAMQEDCTVADGAVLLPAGLRAGLNVRKAGEDLQPGAVALTAGTRLRPQELGVAASLGLADLPVFAPLRVALFSTGDELAEPGDNVPAHGIYDANRPALAAMLRGFGLAVTDGGRLADEASAVRAALADAAGAHHAVITSGGASTGDADHVVAAVRALGAVHAWRLAIKPGRPLALGQVGEAAFIGLPGNPVAALVCTLMFARPLLRAMAGGGWPEPRRYPLPAAFDMDKKPGRREWLRARAVEKDGVLHAEKAHTTGSGILTTLSWADGLIELHEDVTQVRAGDPVPYLPFGELT